MDHNRIKRYFRTDRTGLETAANRLSWATVGIILVVLWVAS